MTVLDMTVISGNYEAFLALLPHVHQEIWGGGDIARDGLLVYARHSLQVVAQRGLANGRLKEGHFPVDHRHRKQRINNLHEIISILSGRSSVSG